MSEQQSNDPFGLGDLRKYFRKTITLDQQKKWYDHKKRERRSGLNLLPNELSAGVVYWSNLPSPQVLFSSDRKTHLRGDLRSIERLFFHDSSRGRSWVDSNPNGAFIIIRPRYKLTYDARFRQDQWLVLVVYSV